MSGQDSSEGIGLTTGSLRPLWRAGRLALDVLLPLQCLGCGAVVGSEGGLCPDCWPKVRFIQAPQCAACGLPFDYDLGDGALCGACSREAPSFARARAAFVYDDASRDLVLAFKHADRTDAAPVFARWMARAGGDLLAEADMIAPVPLHWTRLFRRRYNQAALLALALGRHSGTRVEPGLLYRRRRTPSQGGLGAQRRQENVRGAIAVCPGKRDRIAGRRIIIVDDVFTTGATAAACTRALLRAGAGAVDVLTLARVLRPIF